MIEVKNSGKQFAFFLRTKTLIYRTFQDFNLQFPIFLWAKDLELKDIQAQKRTWNDGKMQFFFFMNDGE